MKKTAFLISAAVLYMFSMNANAVTLQECIGSAVKNSKMIESYNHMSKAYYYDYKREKASLYPQLSLNAEGDYNAKFQETIGMQISLDLQRIIARYPELSYLQLKKAKLIRQIIRHEIEKNITQQYYNLYILKKKKESYEKTIGNFRKHLKKIKKLRAMGLDVGLSISRVNIKINSLKLKVDSLNNGIENILTALNSAMDSNYTEKDFDIMKMPAVNTDKAYFDRKERDIAGKIKKMEQYRLHEITLQAEKQKYSKSKYYWVPSVQFGANYNIYNAVQSNDYLVYASISAPLFGFGKLSNERTSLKENYLAEKSRLEQFSKNFVLRIRQLVTEIENLQGSYLHARINLDESIKSLKQTSVLYQKGKLQEIDILDIYSQYLDAQTNLYDVMQQYLNKTLELDYIYKGGEL